MKMLMALLITSSAFASDHMETFFRANSKEALVEASYFHRVYNYDNDGNKTTNSSAIYDLTAEYGYTDDISFGVLVSKAYSKGNSGFRDHMLYAKGNYSKLYYEVDILIPSESEATNDNYSWGAGYTILKGGIELIDNFALKLEYRPGFEANYENIDKYEVGAKTRLTSAYEFTYTNHIFGIELEYERTESNKEDGENNQSDASIYLTPRLYANLHVNGLEINAKIGSAKYIGDQEDLEVQSQELKFGLRKRF